MQTITTKYHGPGNVCGSRIIARTTSGERKTFAYQPALNADDNHMDAAYELAKSLKWPGTWRGGHIKGGMVWVSDRGDTPVFDVRGG